jgi:uncharacterized membrane protein YccC
MVKAVVMHSPDGQPMIIEPEYHKPVADSPGHAAGHTADRVRLLYAQLTRVRKELSLGTRTFHGLQHAVMSAAAALLAYLPTQFLGIREGFWAAITAIGVVQTEFGATQSTARDQFAGAALGGLIGLSVAIFMGHDLVSYTFAVVLSIVACWVINIATAARLAGVTATIILIVPHVGATPQQMMISRVSEVGWGVTVAIFVVWLSLRIGFTHAGPKASKTAASDSGPRQYSEEKTETPKP